ncbi:MAG: NAD(P)-dependent glycerol-3-phosphate dehydrogenase [Myxococcales bacterium]|nr:NAD(P)-dependent glycerol-3-phosphate dehydrogenase [Myxococcales bacterium]
MRKVAVLGAGAWGTALAKVLADKGLPTALWARRPELTDAIERDRANERYLPGAALPPTLTATARLGVALEGAELVVLVVPSHAMRDTMREAAGLLTEGALLCSASKGIENATLMLMSEVLVDVLGRDVEPRLTFLSGPSFAQEVATRQPTTVVVAGRDKGATERVQHAFATDRFRVYASDDVVGVEVGGALKNVVAIAAGICDGLGFGTNTRAALITRGLAEMSRLAAAKGAQPLTLAGLSGMGDLVLTCTGSLSRNRTVGCELGRGKRLAEILAALGHVAEGVKTTKSAHDLGKKLGVELPITNEVYRVLYEDKTARQAVIDLMTRPLKSE